MTRTWERVEAPDISLIFDNKWPRCSFRVYLRKTSIYCQSVRTFISGGIKNSYNFIILNIIARFKRLKSHVLGDRFLIIVVSSSLRLILIHKWRWYNPSLELRRNVMKTVLLQVTSHLLCRIRNSPQKQAFMGSPNLLRETFSLHVLESKRFFFLPFLSYGNSRKSAFPYW